MNTQHQPSHISTDPHRSLPILTAGVVPEKAAGTLLLLHGRGASAQSMLNLYEELEINGLGAIAPRRPKAHGIRTRF